MAETFESKIAKKFKLDDKNWMKHANPWSVYTRTSALPILILAIWSRLWFGWWSLLFVIIALVWIWVNPRVFPEVKTTDNWASRGVFGERVWLNRKNIPVPEHYRKMLKILNAIQGFGLIFLVYGLWYLDFWSTLVGLILAIESKLWYVDGMVCLYEDMKNISEYGKWERRYEKMMKKE